jgi:hypothetical protein
MPVTAARSRLHVEGKDDLHLIANLIKEYGIDWKTNPSAPEIKEIGSVTELLDGIETAVQLSSGRVIGFVLDADQPLSSRWASVRQRLTNSGVDDVPETLPNEGFIGFSTQFKSSVGVWLMPDNLRHGALEDFLQDLIHENDPLIGHAEISTDQAKALGAAFEVSGRLKAIIHAWLAWQRKPGLPYGSAVTAKYFCHDKEIAKAFIRWFVKLYNLAIDAQ